MAEFDEEEAKRTILFIVFSVITVSFLMGIQQPAAKAINVEDILTP